MENREMTWEEELQQMELEKEAAKKVYADKVAEQKRIDIESERHRARQFHKLDCGFLENYNMTYEEAKEFYKDKPEWDLWFNWFYEKFLNYGGWKYATWQEEDLEEFFKEAPDKNKERWRGKSKNINILVSNR